ncbi:MAG: 6,7-dimethyl-8-ribityllumazine synthase [Aquabacterium sp.]
MPHFEGDLRAPEGARFAIIASRWNPRITERLVDGARDAFDANGVAEDEVDVVRVPGAWELPAAARVWPSAVAMPPSSRWAAWCAATPGITNRWPTAVPTA